ncbi:hypothetical protein DID96_36495 [Burkholderia sp. Bp8963]|uniref:hypothetical protein n=1 Tax=Burkholderia sp. Bp8963 TaxID=2184547 RepID=UPI000F5B1D08|nr:hypothetical protein [Burkholderia sp. Bp8963]RQS57825.1 hypothetical protein DID96_36495 [Burkholderia sp. Bp8963]
MKKLRMVTLAVAASVGMALAHAPVAFAQDGASGASGATPGATSASTTAPTQKQLDKAKRKAERKAKRAKHAEDLRKIEHSGYSLTGDKSATGKTPAGAASAPAGAASAPGQ